MSYTTPEFSCWGRLIKQDLITYTAERVTPSLRLSEAVVGSGGKCGSVALDKAFLKLLKARVGSTFRKWPRMKTSRGSSLMKAFDTAKREFGTIAHTEGWQIPLVYIEDHPEKGIEDCELHLTRCIPLLTEIFYLTKRYQSGHGRDIRPRGQAGHRSNCATSAKLQ